MTDNFPGLSEVFVVYWTCTVFRAYAFCERELEYVGTDTNGPV